MTDTQRWLSKRYLAYRFFTNSWFIGVIWLYFYRLFITDQQAGILDGLAFAIGLLAEIPSGALADKYGRDKIVRIGQVLTCLGILMQGLGSSFVPFFVGQAVLMIGVSFVSGADEALFFEKLNFKRASIQWRKLVTRGSQAALIGTVIATIGGGLVYVIDPRIPWFITAACFAVAVILIWPLTDTKIKNRVKKHQMKSKII